MGGSHLLNELESLRASLAAQEIETVAWHPWLKGFKKGPALIAELDAEGELARVSLLQAEQVARLRNIAPDNHNSFPGFNLDCPLLKLEDASLWDKPDALWERAESAIAELPSAYTSAGFRRLERLLRDFPLQEIEPRLAGGGAVLQATVALLQRLATGRLNAKSFVSSLALKIYAGAQTGELTRELALELLFGKPNRKQSKLESWRATLILEVSDIDRFPYRVSDPAVASEISNLLLRPTGDARHTSFRCALSGKPDSPVGKKMPEPNLPILGPTYLMSMNRDAECQTRYGKTSTDIFAVGENSIRGLSDAIQFMTESGRREKTWTAVPNGFKDNSDLLIAYLEDCPADDLEIVSLFADPSSLSNMATYESRTKDVCDALARKSELRPDNAVRVIALSQIDKGRKQVVFNGRYSASSIYTGRDKWLAGSRNIPDIRISFPIGKGKRAECGAPFHLARLR